jgi:glycosyltransferase involved in cell wall biosynthesis
MAESGFALTVAICTRDRRSSLLRALASLARQKSSADWDVLVIDNGSADDTCEAVAALGGDFPVRLALVCEPSHGLSHARNRALREARGRAVVYIDDDVTLRAGWLEAHARALAGPDVLATGGPILPVLPDGLAAGWRAFLEAELGGPTGRYDFGREPQEIPGPRGILLPFGGNLGVVRSLALGVGGFRTDLGFGPRRIPGEETEFLRRLRRLPGRILYVPDAALDHHLDAARASPEAYLRWNRGYGRGLARVHPPRRAGERVARIGRQLLRALFWTLRGRDLRSRRERERSLGQVLELLSGV